MLVRSTAVSGVAVLRTGNKCYPLCERGSLVSHINLIAPAAFSFAKTNKREALRGALISSYLCLDLVKRGDDCLMLFQAAFPNRPVGVGRSLVSMFIVPLSGQKTGSYF